MASDSAVKGPPTPPSSSSSNPADSYIGSFISLVSMCEIRYEGVLYFLNIQDSTIGLKDVRSYGTEGRRKDGPQIPPSDKVYEYILFRGNDIKNLQIKSPPASTKSEEQTFSDPAIIQVPVFVNESIIRSKSSFYLFIFCPFQSQYDGMLNSPVAASVGGRRLTEPTQWQDTPAVTSKALPAELPSHQSATRAQLGPSNQCAGTQVAGHPSFPTPKYWQGDSGISSINSNSLLKYSSLQSPSISPLSFQNWMQTPETQAPTKVGWTSLSEPGLPVSSAAASSLVNLTHSPSPTSLQISDSLDVPSLFSAKTPVPYSTSMTFNGSNMPSFGSPLQDRNSIIAGQVSEKASTDPRSIYPGHSVYHPTSSFVGSTSGAFPAPPSLLTPDHFAHPEEHFSPLTQNLTAKGNDMGSLIPTSSGSSVLLPSPASQAPLLPLPTLVQKPQSSASQFTEEFDFEAMNEKFKKDEVWGSLGKATTQTEGVDDNASSISFGDAEIHGMTSSPKSAYKKDDFFDTISCNSMTRGRGGRMSERMKLDTETFGNFQQRHNVGYGGYGPGRGANFRGAHNWGRGYGYGGRGRGPNFHHFQ